MAPRRLRGWVVVVAALGVLSGCGSDTAPGDQAAEETSSTSDGRLSVEPFPGPAPVGAPDELADLVQRMLGLVESHDEDFSGTWYDGSSDQVVIGVATDRGTALLERKGFTDEPRLRAEPARWSRLGAQHILRDWEHTTSLRDRLSIWGTRAEGDGFLIVITGDDLSDAERADLLELPGQVDVQTGGPEGAAFAS